VRAPKRELQDITGKKRGLAMPMLHLTDRIDIKEHVRGHLPGVGEWDRGQETRRASPGLFLLTAAVLNPGNRRPA